MYATRSLWTREQVNHTFGRVRICATRCYRSELRSITKIIEDDREMIVVEEAHHAKCENSR